MARKSRRNRRSSRLYMMATIAELRHNVIGEFVVTVRTLGLRATEGEDNVERREARVAQPSPAVSCRWSDLSEGERAVRIVQGCLGTAAVCPQRHRKKALRRIPGRIC